MAAKKQKYAEQPRALLSFINQTAPANTQIVWKPVYCSGFDDVCLSCGRRKRKASPLTELPKDGYFVCLKCGSREYERCFHHFENIPCQCPPGPQYRAYLSAAFETAIGGGRGGIKTETGFARSIRGNPDLMAKAKAEGKEPRPVDLTYIASPHYRFLVLRKNAKDMKDCWRRAKKFYSMLPIPAEFNDSDMIVRFASGAEGVFDHMATEDAYEKYQGQEFQFIWAEELTQIPKEELYQRITLSCRSSFPELRQSIYVTANPGGPGHSWFLDRFVNIAPEGTIYIDPVTGMTRMFIHSTVFDNPYFLRDNATYVKQLASIPTESLRKKWFLGDFSALEGQFFTEWRETRSPDEPEHAFHVAPYGTVDLAPHWKRWISMDWGYSHVSAVLWHCAAADQRTYTYREMVDSRVGTREWGVRIAQASISDLRGLPENHMVLYLSPDAFWKTDERGSEAEQIAAGIADVLGQGSVFLVDFTEEEKALSSTDAWSSLKQRQALQFRTSITIQRASTNRTAGWATIREKLRWWSMLPDQGEADPKMAEQLLLTKGVTAYAEYIRQIEAWKAEVLPKWRVFGPLLDPVTGRPMPNTGCPKLIKALPALQHQEGKEDVEDLGVDANDCGDSLRYGLHNVDSSQNAMPREAFVSNAVTDLGSGASGHSRFMAAKAAEQRYDQHAPFKPFNLPRSVGRHRREMLQ